MALGSMLVALLAVLVLSIVMASRQYDLVELRAQEQALIQQNEALSQEIEFHQAPQDLAIRASQLGLVAASSQATLDLQTGEITGTPLAAVEGEANSKNLISPPPQPIRRPTSKPAPVLRNSARRKRPKLKHRQKPQPAQPLQRVLRLQPSAAASADGPAYGPTICYGERRRSVASARYGVCPGGGHLFVL